MNVLSHLRTMSLLLLRVMSRLTKFCATGEWPEEEDEEAFERAVQSMLLLLKEKGDSDMFSVADSASCQPWTNRKRFTRDSYLKECPVTASDNKGREPCSVFQPFSKSLFIFSGQAISFQLGDIAFDEVFDAWRV